MLAFFMEMFVCVSGGGGLILLMNR